MLQEPLPGLRFPRLQELEPGLRCLKPPEPEPRHQKLAVSPTAGSQQLRVPNLQAPMTLALRCRAVQELCSAKQMNSAMTVQPDRRFPPAANTQESRTSKCCWMG
jgi:hypothetical protein